MATDIRDALESTTPQALPDLDLRGIERRGRRRRRLRHLTTTSIGLVVILAAGFTASSMLGPTGPAPIADQPDSLAAGKVWRQAHHGTLNLPADAWTDPGFRELPPTRAGTWDPSVRDIVEASVPERSQDQAPLPHLRTHVGPRGQLLFTGPVRRNHVIAVDEHDVQHVVTLNADRVVAATWTPAENGSWLLLTSTVDGTWRIERLASDGQAEASIPLPGFDPERDGDLIDGDAELLTVDEKIWLRPYQPTANGTEALLLSDDGGATFTETYDWQPLEETPLPAGDSYEYEDLEAGPGVFHFPTLDRPTTVNVDYSDNSEHSVIIVTRRQGAWVHARTTEYTAGSAADRRRVATVLMATPETVWATGFADPPTPIEVAQDPEGQAWLVAVTGSGYELTRLTPPTPETGVDRNT